MYPYEMFDPLFEADSSCVLNVHMKSSHTTFVKLSCAGYEKQTSAKSEKHSATFNEEFDFTVTDPKAVLRVELWTKGSMFTTSRILGVLDITPLEQVRENVVENTWYTMLHPRNSKKRTNIQISLKLRWFKTISTDDSDDQTSVSHDELKNNDSKTTVSTKENEDEVVSTPQHHAPRKLSLLLSHVEEGDKEFEAYRTATRGCISLPSRFEGRNMYRFLFKYCGVTNKDEAMEICNRMLSLGLIWDPSYLRFRKGRRVRVLSVSRNVDDDKYPDGVITAIGSEGTEKIFVITMSNDNQNTTNQDENKVPEEMTCPIRQLIPLRETRVQIRSQLSISFAHHYRSYGVCSFITSSI